MIVGSLLLILVAVVLLVIGLLDGSSALLIASIAASLLAAVALVAGARQAAAARATADPTSGPDGVRHRGATGATGAQIPVQHIPTTVGADGSGWRQPPEGPSGADRRPRPAPGPGADEPLDEPDVEPVAPADAALVARLLAEVRVVQGRPRYHLEHCTHLLDRVASALPVAEAVELGFTPCGWCAPDAALLADARLR